MQIRISLLYVLFLLLATPAIAQITNSSMTGFIKDETGQGLPGATVRAIHEPSGTTYGTATQNDGSFNIQNMRVGGPYRVEVSYVGYNTQTFGNIFLTLGEPYDLKATMAQGGATALKEVNIISGRNPLLNNQRTGASTNVGAVQINTLPTASRSITDFTRLSPQAGPSSASGLNNANTFGGRDGRYNNVQINGANVNNAFGVSSNLLPGGTAQPISLDAIEEIQIGIAPYDVRQNSFTGANVNAITRSGNNNFTGSVYTFWRNQNFNGVHVGDRDLPEQGAATNNIYGARVGGPIIKNKLFFFLNGEYEKFVYPGVTWVANRAGASGNVSRTPADSLEVVRNYVMSKYGYDPGAYENYANNFTNKNTKFLVRIDWNITDKHKLFVSYSQLHNTSDQLVNGTSSAGSTVTNTRIGANSISFQNSNYSFENTVKSFSAELSSTLGGKLSNQLLATYTVIRDQRISPSANFPFIDIVTSKANTTDNYISLGYELFSYQNDLKNKSLYVADNLTWTSGPHTVTGGLSYERLAFGNSFLNYGTGYYRYATVSDFINDRRPLIFAYGYPYQGTDPYANLNFGQGAIYIQDKINLTDRLAVTAGIRVDMPFYLNDLKKNPFIDTLQIPDRDGVRRTYDVGKWPDQKPLWAPRIGFNWDALGNRKLQVRGGTGIFSGRLPFVWFTNQVGGSGTLTNTVTFTDSATLSNVHFNPDPNAVALALGTGKVPTEGGRSVPGEIAVVSPDFKLPQVWRTNLAADFKLPLNLIGTMEAIFTKDIVNVYQRNANLPAAQGTLNSSGDHRPYYTSNRIYSNLSGIYVLENTNKGESFSFTVGLARPARKGVYGSLYYTLTYADDVSSNPGSRASTAWNSLPNTSSPNELVLGASEYLTPHRLIGSLSYRIEYLKHLATTVSLFYEGASAGRYSYRYTSDLNKDGVNADLIYIPNNASELLWADITYKEDGKNKVFTRQDQIAAFNQYIENDKYLREHKGGYAGRYGAKYPFYHRFDLKILQDVFTNMGKRHASLQLSVDMMNVGNFINPEWGLLKRLNTGSGNNANVLEVASVGANNQPTFRLATYRDPLTGKVTLPTSTFQDDLSTNSTWFMQLGIRLLF